MDLPAPLSCFSRGFARNNNNNNNNNFRDSPLGARPTFAHAQIYVEQKNRSGHGRTGRSGCYGPVLTLLHDA